MFVISYIIQLITGIAMVTFDERLSSMETYQTFTYCSCHFHGI